MVGKDFAVFVAVFAKFGLLGGNPAELFTAYHIEGGLHAALSVFVTVGEVGAQRSEVDDLFRK